MISLHDFNARFHQKSGMYVMIVVAYWTFNRGNRGEKKHKLTSPSEDVSVPIIFSQQFASSVLQLKELPLSFTLCYHEKMYIFREDR